MKIYINEIPINIKATSFEIMEKELRFYGKFDLFLGSIFDFEAEHQYFEKLSGKTYFTIIGNGYRVSDGGLFEKVSVSVSFRC